MKDFISDRTRRVMEETLVAAPPPDKNAIDSLNAILDIVKKMYLPNQFEKQTLFSGIDAGTIFKFRGQTFKKTPLYNVYNPKNIPPDSYAHNAVFCDENGIETSKKLFLDPREEWVVYV